MMGRVNTRAMNKGDLKVKMGKLIPSLKRMNVNLRHRKPEKMSKGEMDIFFQIMNEIIGEHVPIMPEEEEAFRAYQQSFLKKRLLHEWKKGQEQYRALRSGSNVAQIKASQSVYNNLKPILHRCFAEEYQKSNMVLNRFTLRAFLWNQQYLTRRFGLYRDCQCWSEMLNWMTQLNDECFL